MARGRKLTLVATVLAAGGLGIAYTVFFTPESRDELTVSSNRQDMFGFSQGEAGSEVKDPTGRWEIQPGSEAGYRVREKLARLPASSDAVGRTDAVSGGLTVAVEGQEYVVKDIEIQVDVSQLESDSPRRDTTLKTRGLETDRFPTASFIGKGPIYVPDDADTGEAIKLSMEGMLTIHEVTRQVSIPIEARLDSNEAEVAGSFTFPMAEFGIEPPNVANIVTVEPTATMEFRILLAKAA